MFCETKSVREYVSSYPYSGVCILLKFSRNLCFELFQDKLIQVVVGLCNTELSFENVILNFVRE